MLCCRPREIGGHACACPGSHAAAAARSPGISLTSSCRPRPSPHRTRAPHQSVGRSDGHAPPVPFPSGGGLRLAEEFSATSGMITVRTQGRHQRRGRILLRNPDDSESLGGSCWSGGMSSPWRARNRLAACAFVCARKYSWLRNPQPVGSAASE